jgi:CBS domain-containing protein
MTSPAVTVEPETEVRGIAELLLKKRISAVPVVSGEGNLVGIVSEGDLMKRAEGAVESPRSWWLTFFNDPVSQARRYVKHHGRFARDVMTRDVVTVTEDATLPEIATLLEERRIKRVPVLRDGEVVGIVSRANLLQGVAAANVPEKVSASDDALRAALNQAIEESGIRATFLNVIVTEGVAHLWGVMESRDERDALRVIVENAPGLRRVENHIAVFAPSMLT